MKSLSNILIRSNMTPRERVTAIVQNSVHREKTGKDILSDSDMYAITRSWNPRALEAREYNKYIEIVQLEDHMKMDTQMFSYKSEISLLRNQRVIDSFCSARKFKKTANQIIAGDISVEESAKFLTESTYLDHEKVLHIFTFNNLPKEIQSDLLLLDEEVVRSEEYLGDQVFIYERFKTGDKLSKQDKDLIVNRIYSRMYYEKVKRIRNSTSEKDGFLLHSFFAELPIKDVFKKLANDMHITYGEEDADFEESLLSAIEDYAKSKNMSMEYLIKDMLYHWLSDGLFIKDYSPIFRSEQLNTWNGNTKKNHKDLFTAWYTELQKSKQYFQNLFDDGKLKKEVLKKDFLGMPRMTEIITGASLYVFEENPQFAKEYRQQIEILLPLSNMFLFVKKHAMPIKNYKTLCEFKKLAKQVSDFFDIDMTERYDELINLYKEEVDLLNHSLSKLADVATEYLYANKEIGFKYTLDFIDKIFSFDLNGESGIAEIAERYSEEFTKLGM